MEPRPGRSRSFEEAREDVREVLRARREVEVLEAWYERETRKAEIEYVRD